MWVATHNVRRERRLASLIAGATTRCVKSFRGIALVIAPLFALAIAACSSTLTTPDDGAKKTALPSDPRADTGGASSGSKSNGGGPGDGSSMNTTTSPLDASTQSDAAVPLSWCGALGAKMDRCDHERACGDKFDAWCTQFSTMNSAIYTEADAACLATTCEVSARSDCRFRHYRREALSTAQTALLDAYCASCGDADCAERTLRYNSAAGPNSVSDAFIASWELSEPIVDAIRTRCTGLRDAGDAGDAGTASDRATCVHDFGQCAADVYFEVLPDCP